MKKMLMLLASAAALTATSCSSDNNTAATTDTTATTETTTTVPTGYTDADYNSRADRISGDMASRMNLDTATQRRVRTVYYNREKRLGDLQNQYMSDTTGMAAAQRNVYSQTDMEMREVFPDQTQYSAYESSRPMYMEERYMESSPMNSTADGAMSSSSSMDVDKMKIKGEEGGKLKVKGDGDVKMKDAEGNKAKVAGDDGTVKMKPEDGDKTVIK